MTSSDPIRFGAMPIANVVRLTSLRGNGLGIARITTARSRGSQDARIHIPGGKTLIRA